MSPSEMGIIRELSEQEKAVGQRFAAARRFAGLSQQELASVLGLTRDQLANIETGRTELGFTIGWNACKKLGIRQLYLAFGTPPMTPFFDQINPFDTDLKKPSSSFYQAMTMTEPGSIGRLLAFTDEFMQKARSPFNTFSDGASSLVRTFLSRLPEESYPNLMEHLYCALQAFELSVRRKATLAANPPGNPLGSFNTSPLEIEKKHLPNVTASGNTTGVRSPMEALLARLNQATSQRGMKSRLAEIMGVPLANVSQWLSGEREPGGETTLRLLQWVEQQERSNKIPDNVRSTIGAKSAQSETHHEKHSQDRKEK